MTLCTFVHNVFSVIVGSDKWGLGCFVWVCVLLLGQGVVQGKESAKKKGGTMFFN